MGENDSFLVDLFQVKGGQTHDYHFHGLPFGQFSTTGLDLVSTQEKGTLLGPDIEWDGDRTKNESGYDFLKNVRRYKPTGMWRANWVGREDCVLAYYMPPFPEVIVTNGEPPMKPDYPEKMEFLVVRDHAPESVFPAVIVPSKGGDIVKEVSIGRDGDTVKYAVNAPDGLWKITVGINTGEVTAEHFGSSPLPRASLSASGSPPAEASYGDKADYTFRANTPGDAKQECQFTIKEADYLTDTVQVNETITDPKRLLGQVAIISGHGHSAAAASAAYTVAEAGEHFLRFSGPAITGMCIMEKNEGNTVSSKTRLSGYGTQLTARSLNGMVLVSEDYKDAAAIVSYELKEGIQFHMDKPLATPDANNDDRCVAWFADFGPGYVIRISLVQ